MEAMMTMEMRQEMVQEQVDPRSETPTVELPVLTEEQCWEEMLRLVRRGRSL